MEGQTVGRLGEGDTTVGVEVGWEEEGSSLQTMRNPGCQPERTDQEEVRTETFQEELTLWLVDEGQVSERGANLMEAAVEARGAENIQARSL